MVALALALVMGTSCLARKVGNKPGVNGNQQGAMSASAERASSVVWNPADPAQAGWVKPYKALTCVEIVRDQTQLVNGATEPAIAKYRAHFKYGNANTTGIIIPVGANNNCLPGGNCGQPTEFLPGRVADVWTDGGLSVDFGPAAGSTVRWGLLGSTSTASANSIAAGLGCKYHVYVNVKWLSSSGAVVTPPTEVTPGQANAAFRVSLSYDQVAGSQLTCSFTPGQTCVNTANTDYLDVNADGLQTRSTFTVNDTSAPQGWTRESTTFKWSDCQWGWANVSKNCAFEVVYRQKGVTQAGNPTPTPTVTTTPSIGQCTLSMGYWKNHDAWPLQSLKLGNLTYTQVELTAILNTSVGGNGLIALAHQLIAVKLDIANGSNSAVIQASVSAADAMIGNLRVGVDALPTATTSALVDALDLGYVQKYHCP
jgi:hypothetical protein